jgi:hypothetical protein
VLLYKTLYDIIQMSAILDAIEEIATELVHAGTRSGEWEELAAQEEESALMNLEDREEYRVVPGTGGFRLPTLRETGISAAGGAAAVMTPETAAKVIYDGISPLVKRRRNRKKEEEKARVSTTLPDLNDVEPVLTGKSIFHFE